MAFLTRTFKTVRSIADTFNDPIGALDTVSKWRIIRGVNGTDIEGTGTVVRGLTNAGIPVANLRAVELLRPYTCRISMSLSPCQETADGVREPQLFIRVDGVTHTLDQFGPAIGFSTTGAGAATVIDKLEYGFVGGTFTSITLASTLAVNNFYRVGMEMDLNEARFYLNTTVGGDDSTYDSGLVLMDTLRIPEDAGPYGTVPLFVGVGSQGNDNSPFNRFENMLYEEFVYPYSTSFPGPGGSPFAVSDLPYHHYKRTHELYELLTRARIV